MRHRDRDLATDFPFSVLRRSSWDTQIWTCLNLRFSSPPLLQKSSQLSLCLDHMVQTTDPAAAEDNIFDLEALWLPLRNTSISDELADTLVTRNPWANPSTKIDHTVATRNVIPHLKMLTIRTTKAPQCTRRSLQQRRSHLDGNRKDVSILEPMTQILPAK